MTVLMTNAVTCTLAAVIRVHSLPVSKTVLTKSSPGWHNLLLYHRLRLYDLTIKLLERPLKSSAITKGKIGTHLWDISVANLSSRDFLIVRL